MQSNHNPFPLSGDNFRTVAHVQTELELAVVFLGLGFPVLDECTDTELAEDYAVAMVEFKRQIAAGECTDTANFVGTVIAPNY